MNPSRMRLSAVLLLTLLALLTCLSCSNARTLICTRVVDGDTIILSNGEKVRLIGVDTPETKSYRRGKFNPPKNGKVRKVDMSDQLTDVLKGLITTRKKEALKSGKGELPDLLFTQGGDVMEQNFVRKIHNRILMKAGIRKIRIHDLRHTYASLLLTQGESPVYVKEQLGHHSIQITVDIYGHLIPS